MDKAFLQRSFGRWVRLCGQTNQSLLEHISFKWLKASDNYIDSHVILVPSEKMRLWKVFAYQIAWALWYVLLFTHHSDPSAAAWGSWFHYVHVFESTGLSFLHPPFIVFRKKISWWTYLELSTVLPPLSLTIPPEVAFVANVPSPGKVIKLLELVHVLELAGSDQTCPEAVPSCSIWETEACYLESVHNAIVSVRRIIYFEG